MVFHAWVKNVELKPLDVKGDSLKISGASIGHLLIEQLSVGSPTFNRLQPDDVTNMIFDLQLLLLY